eukprot:TRINITY_DN8757_c0_g2_i1.p1 TRINITY_DN8757_c0_g2~~TRINITY_DN8757_c0_g2_i1.p1  ORF type:complete len:274 (-),score=30.92 TRINITY_DN8757_c0_g2_i1:66-887(-)
MRTRTKADCTALLGKWEDSGFIYQNAGFVQLLVPADGDEYHKRATSTTDTLFLRAALLGTLLGWGGRGSAGHVIEDYILERLTTSINFARHWAPAGTDHIPTDFRTFTTTSLEQATTENLINVFFNLTRDTGLDGAFICWSSDDQCLELHTLQIKSGNLAATTTLGGRAAKERMDDQTAVGIIEKAKRGIARLISQLRPILGPTFPGKTTFTLFTTKTLHLEARQGLQAGFDVDIDSQMVHVDGLPARDQISTLALFEDSFLLLLGLPWPGRN